MQYTWNKSEERQVIYKMQDDQNQLLEIVDILQNQWEAISEDKEHEIIHTVINF